MEHSLWPDLLTDKPPETTRIEVLFLNTKSLYVHVRHLEWLISYIASEANLGGVEQESCKKQKVKHCNCEVPGLYVEWDFKNEGYHAEFVDGPLAGKSFLSSPANITEEKFAAVADRLKERVSLEDAKHAHIKDAALQYLLRHCESLLGNSLLMLRSVSVWACCARPQLRSNYDLS